EVSGAGLDASGADYADLIARAVEVNAGIWAKQVNIVAGTQTVAHTEEGAPQAGDRLVGTDAAPQFAVDVAQLGGMYAGKILLVGTEAGVGVRNAGEMGAGVGEVIVTADGQIINAGRIHAAGDVALQSGADIDNRGAIYAGGSARVRAQGTLENSGSIAAAEHTEAIARYIASGGLMAAGLDTEGKLSGTGDLKLQAERVRSFGKQLAAGTLGLSGDELDLAGASHFAGGEFYAGARDRLVFDGGSVSAARLNIQAGSLSNAGGMLTQWGQVQGQIISAGGINNQDGHIQGTGQLLVRSQAVLNNRRGHISGQGGPNTLIVLANDLDNTDGRIHTTAGSGGDLAIDLSGTLTNTRGHISADRDAAVHVGGDHTHRQSASLIAGRHLSLSATGTLTNEAELIAAGQLA
ncbi:MAG TPA: hypothetical protein PLQ67_10120, partial [Burkholderiaceae bacterium]|nr:hypothetical protein [Burkholderiaceae bacterium]